MNHRRIAFSNPTSNVTNELFIFSANALLDAQTEIWKTQRDPDGLIGWSTFEIFFSFSSASFWSEKIVTFKIVRLGPVRLDASEWKEFSEEKCRKLSCEIGRKFKRGKRRYFFGLELTWSRTPRIIPGRLTPRLPSMRGGTCPLLQLKMQGELVILAWGFVSPSTRSCQTDNYHLMRW